MDRILPDNLTLVRFVHETYRDSLSSAVFSSAFLTLLALTCLGWALRKKYTIAKDGGKIIILLMKPTARAAGVMVAKPMLMPPADSGTLDTKEDVKITDDKEVFQTKCMLEDIAWIKCIGDLKKKLSHKLTWAECTKLTSQLSVSLICDIGGKNYKLISDWQRQNLRYFVSFMYPAPEQEEISRNKLN